MPDRSERGGPDHWTARFSQPILFVILTVIGMGHLIWPFTIPVAVFPATNFSQNHRGSRQRRRTNQSDAGDGHASDRGSDEHRAGPRNVTRSITSRGSADISLFFNWNVDINVPDAAIRQCGSGARAAGLTRHRQADRQPHDIRDREPDSRLQPDVGLRAANIVVGAGNLHDQALRLNRVTGVSMVIICRADRRPNSRLSPIPRGCCRRR